MKKTKISKSQLQKLVKEAIQEQAIEEGFFDKAWTKVKDVVGVSSPCERVANRVAHARKMFDQDPDDRVAPRGWPKDRRPSNLDFEELEDAESSIKRCQRAKETSGERGRSRWAEKAQEHLSAHLDAKKEAWDKSTSASKADRAREHREWQRQQEENKKQWAIWEKERAAERAREPDKEEYCMSCRGGCPDGFTCEKKYNDKLGHSESCCEKDPDYDRRSSYGLEEGSKKGNKMKITKTKLRQAIREAIKEQALGELEEEKEIIKEEKRPCDTGGQCVNWFGSGWNCMPDRRGDGYCKKMPRMDDDRPSYRDEHSPWLEEGSKKKRITKTKLRQAIREAIGRVVSEEDLPGEQQPEQQQTQQREYGSNDFCTEYPDACRGVLGTKRANMPQVPDVANFEKDLADPPPTGIETNEPEKIPDIGQATKAYLDSSDDAGPWPRGDQVEVDEIPGVDPADLTPTQKDTYMDNALKKVAAAESGKWQPWAASVLVSKDDFLLDGHHRWAATIIYNDRHPDKQQKMTVQKIMMPIEQLLKVANAYTDAAGGTRHSGGGTTLQEQQVARFQKLANILKG